MSGQMEKAARVVGGLSGAFGLFLAGRFLLGPADAADGFGVHAPADDPYLQVKAARDLGAGLTLLGLLGRNDSRALGTALLALGTIPVGDALIVRHHRGPLATVLGVHGLTAAIMLGAGAVLRRTAR